MGRKSFKTNLQNMFFYCNAVSLQEKWQDKTVILEGYGRLNHLISYVATILVLSQKCVSPIYIATIAKTSTSTDVLNYE